MSPSAMPHFVEALRAEAEAAVARMKEAALDARRLHARAELMRHMLTTAGKTRGEPREKAVEAVLREWTEAWGQTGEDRAAVAREMRALTEAFHDYAQAPTDAHDALIRAASERLDAALTREGSSLADEMAFRSQCAHGWWEQVRPTPADLPGRKARPAIPAPKPGEPFWSVGCATFCR
jgi:hypothetical protein